MTCFETAFNETGNGLAISLMVAGRWVRARKIARRVESASAEKMRSSSADGECSTIWLNIRQRPSICQNEFLSKNRHLRQVDMSLSTPSATTSGYSEVENEADSSTELPRTHLYVSVRPTTTKKPSRHALPWASHQPLRVTRPPRAGSEMLSFPVSTCPASRYWKAGSPATVTIRSYQPWN